jgi:hypothetical protein
MARTRNDTLSDLDTMEKALTRAHEVIYSSAKSFFQSQHDEAFARVAIDLGAQLEAIKLITPNAEGIDLVSVIREFVRGTSHSSDVPQTSPPGGAW